MSTNIFTWGDSVKVIEDAPENFFPNRKGEVVGFYKVETESEALKKKTEIGTYLYEIEFSDGSQTDIPEKYLELYIE